MITLNDLRPEGETFWLSLTKLAGKIKDIRGYITLDGGGTPTFKLGEIIFEDGSELCCEGEHDFPYVSPYGPGTVPPNMDEDTMQRLYDERNDE